MELFNLEVNDCLLGRLPVLLDNFNHFVAEGIPFKDTDELLHGDALRFSFNPKHRLDQFDHLLLVNSHSEAYQLFGQLLDADMPEPLLVPAGKQILG